MKNLKNDLTVYRGEQFTMHKILKNNDGSPFILSNELENPHWLLTVTDNFYNENRRYIKNYYLSLQDFPRFTLTKPVNIENLLNGSDEILYNTWEDLEEAFVSSGKINCYINSELVELEPSDCVFYNPEDKTYKYYDGASKSLKDYMCNITKIFLSSDTKNWIAQTYFYAIELVTGEILSDNPFQFEIRSSYPILSPSKINVNYYSGGDYA